MTRLGAGAIALAALVSAIAAAGCIVLANGTGGYTVVDGGSSTCTSALECGDSGQVCCLSASASVASFSAVGTCATSCIVAAPQLCAAAAECGEGGACVMQSCDAGAGIALPLQACGAVAGCSVTP